LTTPSFNEIQSGNHKFSLHTEVTTSQFCNDKMTTWWSFDTILACNRQTDRHIARAGLHHPMCCAE